MIGAGAVGAGIAWHLARRGHGITLYDPRLSEPSKLDPSEHPNGTSASLGVLMGHVFRRSSGRSWRLRQRSMELWPQWVDALAGFNPALTLRTPLLQLALDEKTLMHQRVLASKRPHLNLQMVESADCPLPCVGGLLSHQDGRVDPLVLQSALRRAMDSLPIEPIATSVCGLHCDDIAQDQWQVETVAGHRTRHRAVVLCAGRDCQPLLDALGQVRPMTPVLGQALELQLHAGPATWEGWPAVLVTGGFNLIPIAPGRLLLGPPSNPVTIRPNHWHSCKVSVYVS